MVSSIQQAFGRIDWHVFQRNSNNNNNNNINLYILNLQSPADPSSFWSPDSAVLRARPMIADKWPASKKPLRSSRTVTTPASWNCQVSTQEVSAPLVVVWVNSFWRLNLFPQFFRYLGKYWENKLKQLSPRFQFTKINWFRFSQEVMNLSSSPFFQVFLFHFKFQAFVLNFWVPWQISLHNGCLETPTSRYEAFWWCLAKTTGVSCVGGWLLATRLGSTIRL